MEALLHTASFFAAMAVSALASAVWEGAVLAACVYFCLQMFPTLSAAARSVVWLNVFVLLVLLQFVPAMGPQVSAGNALRPAPFELDLGWSFAIAGAWGILSLLRAVQLIWSAIRSSGLAQRATAIDAGDALLALLEVRAAGPKLSRSGKISRVAELCLSDEVERPSVFGFFHPRILLPAALMERLTPQELEQVVVHEMEHLRRSDDWTNLFQKIALMVFPLNPALLWVERRLCAAGAGLRRQRSAREPGAQGVCPLPHAACRVLHGAAQPVTGAGRLGAAIGTGAARASYSAAAGRDDERPTVDSRDSLPDGGRTDRRCGSGAKPAAGELCSARARCGAGPAFAGCESSRRAR